MKVKCDHRICAVIVKIGLIATNIVAAYSEHSEHLSLIRHLETMTKVLTESNPVAQSAEYPEVVGSIPIEVKIFFLYLVWFPDSLY